MCIQKIGTKRRRLVSLLMAAGLLLTQMPIDSAAAARTVSVDGTVLESDEVAEQNGCVYVDIEALSDLLGGELEKGEEAFTTTLICNGKTLVYEADVAAVTSNGQTITMQNAPFRKDGVLFVPFLELLSHLEMSADDNGSEYLLTLPQPLELGLSAAAIRESFGEPARQEASERGYTWLVYPDKSRYQLFGVDENEVLRAMYLHRGGWKLNSGMKQGMTAEECRNTLGLGYQEEDYGAFRCYLSAENLYTLFFDAEGIAYAVLWESSAYMGKFTMSDAVLEGFSNEFYELINVERYQMGLSPLPLDAAACDVANAHAADMAQQGIMGHDGSDGRSAKQRLVDAGVDADYESECVASAYPNALCAFCGLMQQSNYLTTITARFTSVGVGIAYMGSSSGVLYYVQQLVKTEG